MGARVLMPALAFCAIASSAASARPLERELPPGKDRCFERVYDEAHLAAHPKQKSARVMLRQAGQSPGRDGVIYVELMMNLRNRTGDDPLVPDYSIVGACKPKGSALACENEYDAGRWRIESAPGGGVLVRNGGVIMNPHSYDSEDIADNAVKVPLKPDDAAWKLERVAFERCKL